MSEKKLGQEPAFPLTDSETFANNRMSKRFYTTKGILEALIINQRLVRPEVNQYGDFKESEIPKFVKLAYKFTDELLKQENEV